MFKFVCVVAIQSVFAFIIQGSGSEEICLPTWKKREGIHSIEGTEIDRTMSLTECLTYCQSTVDCLAVDFNHFFNSCWAHSDPAYNLSDRVFDDDPEVSQYSQESCVSFKVSNEECPSSWFTSANKSSISNCTEIGLGNFSSCFSYCRFTNSCKGFAFDYSSWPFCKVFSSDDFADPHNLIENPSSTIYSFNKKDCLGNPNTKSFARCLGQTFPQGSQWCPEGSNVTIISLNYKDNPFCCKNVLQQDIFPLDNNQLSTFNINYFDNPYSDSIKSCIFNRSCILRAETNISSITKSVCVTDEKAPNSVSIEFTCSRLQTDSPPSIDSSISFVVYSLIPEVTSTTILPSTTVPILSQPSRISQQLSVSSTNALSSPSSTSSSISNIISNSLSPSSSTLSPTTEATSTTSVDRLPQNVTYPPLSTSVSSPTFTFSSPSSTSSPVTIPITTSDLLSSSPTSTSGIYVVTQTDFPKTTSSFGYPSKPTEPPISLPLTNPTTSTSPETSTALSTNPQVTNKENEERTALILGALGTAFGLLSLLLLVLLVVLLCRNLRNNGSDMFETFSWKTIMHGSSVV